MTNTDLEAREAERAAVVAWLCDAPFPWMRERSSWWSRAKVAWIMLTDTDAAVRGIFLIAAYKIKRGDHHKDHRKDEDAQDG